VLVVATLTIALSAVSGARAESPSDEPLVPSLAEAGLTSLSAPEAASPLVAAPAGLVRAAAAAEPNQPEGLSLQELEAAEAELAEYDPWIGFNETMFAFNHGLDTHVLKPVAKAYDKVVPDVVQRAVRNIFENLGSVRRIINSALQGRFNDTGQEFGRFLINSSFGFGGLIDAAPSFGVAPLAEADTGQTFGFWGAGPGPYLVLPLMPPFTIRDAVGYAFDALMDPIAWVLPFEVLLGIGAEQMVNERSLNLELYENVEETVFDLYSAVRNGYLQRREKMIREALATTTFGRRERLILSGPEAQPARPESEPAAQPDSEPESQPEAR
jgi:phospholipid-binding lipoprotein MlaA